MLFFVAVLWLEDTLGLADGVIFRLAGTTGPCMNYGRLEVYYNNRWGTICDDSFNNTDARVACRYFGFSDGVAKTSAYYGEGYGNIWMNDLNCVGTERSLEYCSFRGWGIYDCHHNEDVGVLCGTGCKSLLNPSNGFLSSTNADHCGVVIVTCHSGYSLIGEQTLRCLSGRLSGSIGVCKKDCRNLVTPPNGYLSSTNIAHGSYVTVYCNSRYTLSGERTLVCSSGSLSGSIGRCQADCRNLVTPPNGYLSSTNIAHGSYVTVYCNSRYTLSGERTLVCSSGSLSGSIGRCQADCRNLVRPPNGYLSSTNIAHGSYVTVYCNPGYTLSGERTLVCSSGSLSGSIGRCQEDCRGLVAPKNGSLSASAVVHGRHLTVSCNAGYTLSGDRSLVCSSGSLSGKIGTCEADCNGLAAPANGTLSSINVTNGDFVTLSCDSGYKIVGNSTLFCSSGSLLGDIGTCEIESAGASALHTLKNIEESTMIAVSVASGIIIIALTGAIILQYFCFKRTRKEDHGTLPIQLANIQEQRIHLQNSYGEICPATNNETVKKERAAENNRGHATAFAQQDPKCQQKKEDEGHDNFAAAENTMVVLDDYEQLTNLDRSSTAERANIYENLKMRMSAWYKK